MEDCTFNWKHIFVKESGLIDPQPGFPCYKPGQLMFDNHMAALNFVLSDGWELNPSTPLDVHRFLTREVDFFEDRNNSGRYREVDVWIGHETCPSPILIPDLMYRWFKFSQALVNLNYEKKISGVLAASLSHHMFEVVHPFIDGNGRTGRLLFTKILKDCGEDPRIFFFKDRESYYLEIQCFRENFSNGYTFDMDAICGAYDLPPM